MDKNRLRELAQAASEDAASETNQASYNAAWLHGYARALWDILAEMEETP